MKKIINDLDNIIIEELKGMEKHIIILSKYAMNQYL